MRRAAARQRQIDIGKARLEYRSYVETIPRSTRAASHPITPNPNARISKRAFDRQLSQWRRRLHDFDTHTSCNTAPDEAPACDGDDARKGSTPGRQLVATECSPGGGPLACSGLDPITMAALSPGTVSTRADSEELSPLRPVASRARGSAAVSVDKELHLAEMLQPPVSSACTSRGGSIRMAISPTGSSVSAAPPSSSVSMAAMLPPQMMRAVPAPVTVSPPPWQCSMGLPASRQMVHISPGTYVWATPPVSQAAAMQPATLSCCWTQAAPSLCQTPHVAPMAQTVVVAPGANVAVGQSPVLACTNSPEANAAAANGHRVTRVNSEVASPQAGSVHIGGHSQAGSIRIVAPSRSSSGLQNCAQHGQRTPAEQQPTISRVQSASSSIRITPVKHRSTGGMDSVEAASVAAATLVGEEIPTTPTKKRCGSVQDRSSPAQPSSPVQSNWWQHVGTPSPQPAQYLFSAEKPSAPATGSASPSLHSLSEVSAQGTVRSAASFAATASQAHFVRLQGPMTPVARSAFYSAPPSGLGSSGGMQCFSSGGTPVLPILASPGGFPLCRPAPHIVTPAPAPPPLPFGSLTPVHRQANPSHGMTPGPSSIGGRNESANTAECHHVNEGDYTSACMAEWRH